MVIFTPQDELAFKQWQNPAPNTFAEGDEPDPGPESELQSKIVADAKAQGWPYLSFPKSEKVLWFLPPGWPDILIAMPQGRTVYIETKSATGELREKQILLANMFRMLGHEYYKLKSFKGYLAIKKGKPE